MRRRRVTIATLALALALAACGGGAPERPRPHGPELRLTLPALGGGEINFASFRGRMLLVHVFTTWAMPVQDDAERIQRSLVGAPPLAVVGVALDLEGEEVVRPWRSPATRCGEAGARWVPPNKCPSPCSSTARAAWCDAGTVPSDPRGSTRFDGWPDFEQLC